jgi:hypothetical protein
LSHPAADQSGGGVVRDILTGLAAVGQALDIARALRSFEKQINDSEFKMKIADLHGARADAKMALAEAKTMLADKDEEIVSLKRVQSGKMEVVNYRGYNLGSIAKAKPLRCPSVASVNRRKACRFRSSIFTE